MSVLIKGMEMPPKGQGRMFLYDDNTAIWLNLDTGERIAYEVIPVPTPHGRLIDADAIPFVESEDGCLEDYAYRYDINELPTVIEAEEGEG